MKSVRMMVLLAFLMVPVSVYSNTDIQNRKTEIQTKYENERNSENQSYDARVSDAKDKYEGNKLTDVLRELKIQHDKRMDNIKHDEKMDLQKVDERKSAY